MKTDMRSIISILEPTTTTTASGAPIKTWSEKAQIFASKEPILGNEYFQAEAVQSKVEVKFRTYYMDGITNLMRVREGGTDYEILSAINVKGLDRELLMYCRKVR